jgi:hypothetical protein
MLTVFHSSLIENQCKIFIIWQFENIKIFLIVKCYFIKILLDSSLCSEWQISPSPFLSRGEIFVLSKKVSLDKGRFRGICIIQSISSIPPLQFLTDYQYNTVKNRFDNKFEISILKIYKFLLSKIVNFFLHFYKNWL